MAILSPIYHPFASSTSILVDPMAAVDVKRVHTVSGYTPYSSNPPVTASILFPDAAGSRTR